MSKYKRILLKISGESLKGGSTNLHDPDFMEEISDQITDLKTQGAELCIILGGGNIYRGEALSKIMKDQIKSHHVGMLCTAINGLIMQDIIRTSGSECVIMSSIGLPNMCESYNRDDALNHLNEGKIVICVGGTGNPIFTTDTAAALRAVELGCEVIVKASLVDGVYSQDPKKYSNAIKLRDLSYQEVIEKKLGVMDTTSVEIASQYNIPIIVYDVRDKGMLAEVLAGLGEFSIIH